jgi:hypothetical protein
MQFFFCVSQYTSYVIVVYRCKTSTISTPFLSQKTVAISFLADVCLKFFSLFGKYVCIHCFDCSLVSTFRNKILISSPVTRPMWLRNSLSSWCCYSKKVKAEAFLCLLCSPASIFGIPLAQNLWKPCLTVIISYRTEHEICGHSYKSSEIVKQRLSQIF